MNNNHKYSENGGDNISQYFPAIDLNYSETKEEAWLKIVSRLEEKKSSRQKYFIQPAFAIAASLLLLTGIFSFLRFYNKSVYCPSAKHLIVQLPDNSMVRLNAQSSVSFHPFWMKFDRIVELEGEAYFEVKEGSRFQVISEKGRTVVLGTSFNIFARSNEYNVTCFTGSVKVISSTGNQSVIIKPDQLASVLDDGTVKVAQSLNTDPGKSWINNMFFFTGASLNKVIQEIERQYNIKIRTKESYDLTYTGNFIKPESEKDVLDLICTSLQLKFEMKSKGEYLIYKN